MDEKEITYIPYGQDEISLLDLMTSLANGVESYLGSKRWAQKDKYRLAWLNAYQDIINLGLTGASNESGVWKVNHKGNIDLDSKSNLEKEMYLDAAYFIRLQMSLMTPRKKEEEEKKKNEELIPFDFYKGFNSYLIKNNYGGNENLFADPELGWSSLDTRGTNGLRGTSKRKEAMLIALKNYMDSLEEGKYSFEGTPFTDLNDAKNRIQKAINALNSSEEEDDIPAFNLLGLNYRTYFSNGGNDASTHLDSNGNPYTYNLWNQLLLQLAETKAIQDKQNAYNNTLFINRVTNPKMLGLSPRALKEKYKDNNTLLSTLLGYAQKDIRTLSPDELSEIHGAYKYLAKLPIDNKLLHQLQSSSSGLYKNAAPNRFKKIQGIDNLVWDSASGQIIQINNRQLQQVILNQPTDLFAGVLTLLDILNDYMNSTEGGFTPAELREVAALLFDLGAAVDPEGFTSAGLSQIAAGIRDYNRGSDPEGWTLGDTGRAALDHGLGLLSAIPVVGGLVKGSWAAAKLGSYIPKMEKWIRLAGRAGSTYAMTSNASGALNTLNKIKNGEDLSLKDYQDLAYFFIGGLGHHQLNRSNRTARSAMKARGVETSNSILNKTGITRTKPKVNTTETTPTLKIKKTGEDGKIETKEIQIKKEQLEVLRNTKPSEVNAKAKELLGDKIPEGYKVETNTGWRAKTKNYAKSFIGRGNSEIFGTPQTSLRDLKIKSNEEFEQYLSEHNNNWFKKFVNGSNRDIRRYDRNYLNINSLETKKTSPSITKKETPLTSELAAELKQNVKSWRQEHKNILNINKNKGRDYEWSKNDVGTNPERLKSAIKLGDKELNVEIASDGILIINGEKTSINGFGKNGKQQVRKKIKEIVQLITKLQRLKRNTEEFKKLVTELKKLKSSGFLKQGGQINPSLDTIIEDFIKNNNI